MLWSATVRRAEGSYPTPILSSVCRTVQAKLGERPFRALGRTEARRRAEGASFQILVEAPSAASLVPLVQPQGAEMHVRIVRAGCPQAAGGGPAARPGGAVS